MSSFVINGGNKLNGSVKVDASKNAILPIIAGSILCKGIVKIKNCTMYTDTQKMCDILRTLGSKITYENSSKTLTLNNKKLSFAFINNNLTKDIRASIFTLGPMLARFGKAKIAYPGGCAIGQRGIDTHISNFKKLGVDVLEQHGYLFCKVIKYQPQEIYLNIPSVGATENLMMFACALGGSCILNNVAKEPEIVDLANFLNKMGANIVGAGTDCIHICGMKTFKDVKYEPIPDRIVAGTFLIAGAITGGNIIVKNCLSEHVRSLIELLQKTGCKIKTFKKSIHLQSYKKLKSFDEVETLPYPNFPTDLQSQITTLASVCKGTTFIYENIFECRFRYVSELVKMGAKIKINCNCAIVEGKEKLFGAEVYATDLRGGVSLVLAGLCADGYTTVNDVEYIDRGYFELENQLKKLGANIKRI